MIPIFRKIKTNRRRRVRLAWKLMDTYFFDYEPGDRVRNPKAPEWGIGQVQSIIKNRVTVNFEDAGKKTVDGSVIDLERI